MLDVQSGAMLDFRDAGPGVGPGVRPIIESGDSEPRNGIEERFIYGLNCYKRIFVSYEIWTR